MKTFKKGMIVTNKNNFIPLVMVGSYERPGICSIYYNPTDMGTCFYGINVADYRPFTKKDYIRLIDELLFIELLFRSYEEKRNRV